MRGNLLRVVGLAPAGGRGNKERVKEGECGRNIMYSCMKMKNETC
jgi:hypothetical protein